MRRGVLSHIRTADTMRGRRKTVKISEAEWSIMKVLWDGCEKNERGMTLGEIVQELTETTGWSNTTIRTDKTVRKGCGRYRQDYRRLQIYSQNLKERLRKVRGRLVCRESV